MAESQGRPGLKMTGKLGIIGSSSMIATQAAEQLERMPGVSLLTADLKGDISIDVTDQESVENFFAEHNQELEWILLFAAYTDVNGAEAQRNDKEGLCWKINVDGTKNVVAACKKYGKKLVFFSTDFVFDGSSGPYSEEDPTGPEIDKVSWYGITKTEAEKAITESLDEAQYLILRIAYPYSGVDTGKEDLALRTIHYFEKEGKMYPMYDDQIITPTYIPDIAPAIMTLIKTGNCGIYNLVSPKLTTQYEFAKKLLEHYTGVPVKLERGKLEKALEVEGATPRPINGGLKTDKIISVGINPTSWDVGIEKVPTSRN